MFCTEAKSIIYTDILTTEEMNCSDTTFSLDVVWNQIDISSCNGLRGLMVDGQMMVTKLFDLHNVSFKGFVYWYNFFTKYVILNNLLSPFTHKLKVKVLLYHVFWTTEKFKRADVVRGY